MPSLLVLNDHVSSGPATANFVTNNKNTIENILRMVSVIVNKVWQIYIQKQAGVAPACQ